MNWWKKLVNSLKKSKREFGLGFALLLYTLATFFFYNGYHAIDLCRNEYDIQQEINFDLKELGVEYRVDLSEMGGTGEIYNIANGECHIFGSNRMFMSLSIFSTLIIVLLASVFGREGR